MGLEAQCTVQLGRKSGSSKAHLESESLVVRGAVRLEMPLDKITATRIEGGALIVQTADQEVRLDLGAETAVKWLQAIREPKGLLEKLDLSPQSHVAVVDIYDGPFLAAVRERSATLAEGRVPQGAPVIFFGAETPDALRKIALLRARMPETGTLWVVRPKGSRAPVGEADVFAALKSAGLVDTKVVAFSKTHTAHKAVIPLELRGKAIPRPPILSLPPPMPGAQTRKAPARPKRGPAQSTAARAKKAKKR